MMIAVIVGRVAETYTGVGKEEREMRITWRDGVTTLATAGAIVLERAYFHEWNWPLVSSLRWVVVGLAALGVISFFFSYALDHLAGTGWSLVAYVLGFMTVLLAALGLIYNNSDYAVLLMLNAVVFWLVSAARHLTLPSVMSHGHGHA